MPLQISLGVGKLGSVFTDTRSSLFINKGDVEDSNAFFHDTNPYSNGNTVLQQWYSEAFEIKRNRMKLLKRRKI